MFTSKLKLSKLVRSGGKSGYDFQTSISHRRKYRGRQVAVAKFSLIERSEAAKKGPINHEFVNLAAEFANISRTVIGKSGRVVESRDRARASRESAID